MSTEEIDKAIADVTPNTVREALQELHKSTSGTDDEIRKRYQECVLEVGIKNFLSKFNTRDFSEIGKGLGVGGDHKSVEAEALKRGLKGFVEAVQPDILKRLSTTMGLDVGTPESMRQQVSDEVMLTGAEQFFQKLSKAVLKDHTTHLKLNNAGSKKELVERLMVRIFDLEPLPTEKPNKQKPKEKTEKKPKEKAPKKPKKKAEKEGEEGTEEKKEVKREKWVAPPLEQIGDKFKAYQGKGFREKFQRDTELFDNFNLPDLVGYCKLKELKTSGHHLIFSLTPKGKKKDVIKRILEFLEHGAIKEEPQKKKRKKGGKGAKGSAKKQKTDSKESKDSAEKEGEESKPEAPEAKDDSGPDDEKNEGNE